MADTSKGKQSKFELVIGAVDKFSKVFKGFSDRVESATANLNRMQKAVVDLDRATGFNRIRGAVSGVAANMKNVVSEGKNLVSTVTGLAGKFSLVFGAAGGGLFALAKSTANAGDAAAKASARAGVGIKTWQEYAYVASLSDVAAEQLGKGLVKLQDSAIKAFQGDKTQRSILRLAGIDPKTAKGEVKNADTLFQELADKVKALNAAGQGAKAVNLVKNILGEEGTKLMPMLSGGAAGLREMRMEAHKLGLVLSDDDAKASEAFNDGLTRMLGSLKGIGFAIGRLLLPPLTKLMAKFTEWFSKQRDIISGGFAEWVEKLDIDRIWNSIESGISTLGKLMDTINGLARAFGGWENVLIALSAVIGGKFLLSVGSLIVAFGKLALAIMTTPVGWFIAACAAIGLAVYAIYKNWDKIVAYFQSLWKGVKDAFSRNWVEGVLVLLHNFNPVRLILKGMNELFAYFTGINLMEFGEKIVNSFKKGLSEGWDRLMGWFEGKLKAFTEAWDKVKGVFGFGDDAIASLPGGANGYQGSGMGAPLNLGPDARIMSDSRTEHVERNEMLIRVQAENGAAALVSGSTGSGVTFMQVGHQAWGH